VLVLHRRTWHGDRRRSGLQVLVRMEGGETREAKTQRTQHNVDTLLALTPAGVVSALNPRPRPFLSFPKVAILTVEEHTNRSD